jgi:hypothetical protein
MRKERNVRVLRGVKDKRSVKRVVIGSDVGIIGEECFCGCKRLCQVAFESGCKLHRIEKKAFICSGVKTIRIPSSVEIIGELCFCDCKYLSEVTFEEDEQ